MIHEVDDALRTLVRTEALENGQVSVTFDAPTREWAAKVNAPTVNLYLYDIREDMRRRERGLHNDYNGDGVVVSRRRPPRYFKLSYLITAWTRRPEDEHRLLSALLTCLLQHDALPTRLLTGTLAEIGLPVPVTLALPPPEDRSFADVWSALGGELKPSLDLVVSVPVTASPVFPAGPPVGLDGIQLGIGDLPDDESTGGTGGALGRGANGSNGAAAGGRRSPAGAGARSAAGSSTVDGGTAQTPGSGENGDGGETGTGRAESGGDSDTDGDGSGGGSGGVQSSTSDGPGRRQRRGIAWRIVEDRRP